MMLSMVHRRLPNSIGSTLVEQEPHELRTERAIHGRVSKTNCNIQMSKAAFSKLHIFMHMLPGAYFPVCIQLKESCVAFPVLF